MNRDSARPIFKPNAVALDQLAEIAPCRFPVSVDVYKLLQFRRNDLTTQFKMIRADESNKLTIKGHEGIQKYKVGPLKPISCPEFPIALIGGGFDEINNNADEAYPLTIRLIPNSDKPFLSPAIFAPSEPLIAFKRTKVKGEPAPGKPAWFATFYFPDRQQLKDLGVPLPGGKVELSRNILLVPNETMAPHFNRDLLSVPFSVVWDPPKKYRFIGNQETCLIALHAEVQQYGFGVRDKKDFKRFGLKWVGPGKPGEEPQEVWLSSHNFDLQDNQISVDGCWLNWAIWALVHSNKQFPTQRYAVQNPDDAVNLLNFGLRASYVDLDGKAQDVMLRCDRDVQDPQRAAQRDNMVLWHMRVLETASGLKRRQGK